MVRPITIGVAVLAAAVIVAAAAWWYRDAARARVAAIREQLSGATATDGGPGLPFNPATVMLPLVFALGFVGVVKFFVPATLGDLLSQPVLFMLFLVVFAAGALLVPIIAALGGGSLPAPVAEVIANWLFIVTMLGLGRATLYQTDTGHYEIRPADETAEPRSYWTRWAWVRFGISFEKTKEAFGDLVVEKDFDVLEDTVTDGGTIAKGYTRGGKETYIDLRNDEGKLLIPTGEKLAELQASGGIETARRKLAESLADYGGDTAGSSYRMNMVMRALFAFTGIGLGWVVFF